MFRSRAHLINKSQSCCVLWIFLDTDSEQSCENLTLTSSSIPCTQVLSIVRATVLRLPNAELMPFSDMFDDMPDLVKMWPNHRAQHMYMLEFGKSSSVDI